MAKTRRRGATVADQDSPWKEALDHFFEPCLRLFFPNAHAGIDWSRGHEPLDKELQPIIRRSEMGRQAQLKAMETRHDPERRQAWKVQLVKGLYDRGMGREEVRRLFDFIDWVLELPAGLEERFEAEVEAYQEQKRMPFVNTFERRGIVKGLLPGIEALLKLRFGAEGLELMPELREVRDPYLLEEVLHKIETADTLPQVRRFWTRKRKPKAEPSE